MVTMNNKAILKIINPIRNEVASTYNYSENSLKFEYYYIDNNYNIVDMTSVSKAIRNNCKYILILPYYNVETRETSGGNVYLKRNYYSYLVLDSNLKPTVINKNGWTIDALETYGTCNFGYSQKIHTKYRLIDPVGDSMKKRESLYIGKRAFEEILKVLDQHSKYNSVKEIQLKKKLDKVEEENTILRDKIQTLESKLKKEQESNRLLSQKITTMSSQLNQIKKILNQNS